MLKIIAIAVVAVITAVGLTNLKALAEK